MTCIPEKTVQAHIVQLLRSLGARVYVLGVRRRRGDYQGTMMSPGIPDLMVFLPRRPPAAAGSLLFIEVKAAGGRLRPEQTTFRALCTLAAVSYITGDLDAVVAWLMDQGYLRRDQIAWHRLPKEKSHVARD